MKTVKIVHVKAFKYINVYKSSAFSHAKQVFSTNYLTTVKHFSQTSKHHLLIQLGNSAMCV